MRSAFFVYPRDDLSVVVLTNLQRANLEHFIDEVGVDIWMWDAADYSYKQLVEDLRETAFWDRYFEIAEILTGVENACAKNYDRPVITA